MVMCYNFYHISSKLSTFEGRLLLHPGAQVLGREKSVALGFLKNFRSAIVM